MMKQKLSHLALILTLISLLISCNKSIDSKYIGSWVDKNTESKQLNIEKSGDSFIVSNNRENKSYAGKIVDGILEISGESGINRAIISEEGELIISGENFIKKESSLKYGLPGKWENDGNLKFDIQYSVRDDQFNINIKNHDRNSIITKCYIEKGWLQVYYEDEIETGNYWLQLDYKDYNKGYCGNSFEEKDGGRAIVGGLAGEMNRIEE